ncbi:uncharacterized protein YukE [Desulfohalotomaculum tongense]|uniref:DIP1984 family protein n=1 Tax=Desulforadius tongensis TaxID=1216062 RepID=UPI00195E0F60|nr:DIP1984 family protein [Desulforadius tongensis]MBM7855265.1 uncharacterized protein YukE [Desulforadius tongensis]
MKLAEALLERADLQKRLAQMRKRLSRSAVVQEGEEPPEDPKELLQEMNRIVTSLESLVKRINHTNAAVSLEPYGTIADALTRREMIMHKRSLLESLVEEASMIEDRYSHSEIKSIATVSVRELQKEIDALSKEYREVDTRVQQANWLTELK